MKLLTKAWYQIMQDSTLGSQLHADDRAAVFSEELFRSLWQKKLSDMLAVREDLCYEYDIRWDEEAARRLNVEYADIDTIRKEADIISLHIPSTPETDGMINREFLAGMKKTAILVNTANDVDRQTHLALREVAISELFDQIFLQRSTLREIDGALLIIF